MLEMPLIYCTCTGSIFLDISYSVDMLTGQNVVVVGTQHKFTPQKDICKPWLIVTQKNTEQ